MKFKLVENINGGHDEVSSNDILNEETLVESSYGMLNKQRKQDLMKTLLSDRMLSILLSEEELQPGFTIYTNRPGSGIQKVTGLGVLLHHINLEHGPDTLVKLLGSNLEHNKYHGEIYQLIKKFLCKHNHIINKAYDNYTKNYDEVESSATGYDIIQGRFRCYEQFFIDVRNLLLEDKVNLIDLRKDIIDLIKESNKNQSGIITSERNAFTSIDKHMNDVD